MDPLWILGLGIAVVLAGILLLRLHAFLALILAALVVAFLTPHSTLESYAAQQVEEGAWGTKQAESFINSTAASRVAQDFGKTCGSIGILIAMAAIIGKCLLESGAADRIVRSALRIIGEARAGLAFLGSGFVLGIPVFFDTVFYLMIPLGKAMHLRTRGPYLKYVLAIVAGATMAHSLVPPTPGPLLVASMLDVSLGTMILAGCIVGSVTSLAGYTFATWLARRTELPLRDSPDAPLAELERATQRDDAELPSLGWSLAPIVLPVVLIASLTVVKSFEKNLEAGEAPSPAFASVANILEVLGDKNIALILAATIALGVLLRRPGHNRQTMAHSVQNALLSGAVIILITAAGGAFGAAVRTSGVAERLQALTQEVPSLWILPVAFGLTMLMRTAQGSATVAMITGASLVQQLVKSMPLEFHPVYLALAVGCGSKPISWMNDSGFWVICKMSGMSEREGLRTVTPMLLVMGFTGLAVVMCGAWLLPLKIES